MFPMVYLQKFHACTLLGIVAKLYRSHVWYWRILRILTLFFLVFTCFIMFFEERLIFIPSKYPNGNWESPQFERLDNNRSLRIETCEFSSKDGHKLHGWYCYVEPTEEERTSGNSTPRKILFWCHGNAGNLSDRYDEIKLMMQLPIDIFIFDYRGYGKSEGRPTEHGMYMDTEAAWDYLIKVRNNDPKDIIIFGKSLGGAAAIDLASKVEAAGLIVQSSFTSLPDMAAVTFPFIPKFLIRTKMDSFTKIKKVACPKLIIHSRIDEIIPYRLGKKLFENAKAPKTFHEIPDATHNDLLIMYDSNYGKTMKNFIESLPNE